MVGMGPADIPVDCGGPQAVESRMESVVSQSFDAFPVERDGQNETRTRRTRIAKSTARPMIVAARAKSSFLVLFVLFSLASDSAGPHRPYEHSAQHSSYAIFATFWFSPLTCEKETSRRRSHTHTHNRREERPRESDAETSRRISDPGARRPTHNLSRGMIPCA